MYKRDRERGMEKRERERRDRDRERDLDRESSRSRKNYKYNDVNDEPDEDSEKIEREIDEEPYEDRADLQADEDDEEEDLNRIKEESRRRIEVIKEKYKAKSKPQLQDMTKENVEEPLQSVGAAKVNSGTPDCQGEGSDTNIGDTPFSLGRSPPQNGNSGVDKTSGTGGLGEGTPKSEGSNGDDIFGEDPTRVPAGRRKSVVRARDLKAGSGDPEEVAIKIIRNNDKMYKAGLEELVILKKLVAADPDDRRHCVRFLSSFKYRNHLCLVFEYLHMNLREVLKNFGRNIGLKLTGVRAYAKQLFIALKHLRNCGVLHTDIKPDNMLVNEAKNVLKLCDFWNAMFAGKNEITPYLVSRFYRAPEIILGLTYDQPIDMCIEEDPVTKKTVKRLVNTKAKDIGSIVMTSPRDDPKMVASFKDLLEKMFLLDPDKRITVQQALGHPFITGK
nr:serine/threonine-protein kinase prpf4B isoform X1 [Tanacetum cinerariifolium]